MICIVASVAASVAEFSTYLGRPCGWCYYFVLKADYAITTQVMLPITNISYQAAPYLPRQAALATQKWTPPPPNIHGCRPDASGSTHRAPLPLNLLLVIAIAHEPIISELWKTKSVQPNFFFFQQDREKKLESVNKQNVLDLNVGLSPAVFFLSRHPNDTARKVVSYHFPCLVPAIFLFSLFFLKEDFCVVAPVLRIL